MGIPTLRVFVICGYTIGQDGISQISYNGK